MHRKVAVALVAALALVAASCGESGRTLTRAELVRQVDAACRQGQQEMQQQGRARGGVASFLTVIIDGQHVVMARIKNFNGSGEAKDDFAAFKQGVQQRLALFQRLQSGSSAGLQAAIRAAQGEVEALTRRVHDAATRLGFEGCA